MFMQYQSHSQKNISSILGIFALNLVLFSYSFGFFNSQKFICERFEPLKPSQNMPMCSVHYAIKPSVPEEEIHK